MGRSRSRTGPASRASRLSIHAPSATSSASEGVTLNYAPARTYWQRKCPCSHALCAATTRITTESLTVAPRRLPVASSIRLLRSARGKLAAHPERISLNLIERFTTGWLTDGFARDRGRNRPFYGFRTPEDQPLAVVENVKTAMFPQQTIPRGPGIDDYPQRHAVAHDGERRAGPSPEGAAEQKKAFRYCRASRQSLRPSRSRCRPEMPNAVRRAHYVRDRPDRLGRTSSV